MKTARANRGDLSLAGLALLAALALYVLAPATPIVEPDSVGYIGFDPGRTAGYPLLLYLTGLADLIPVQVALNAICTLVLALTIYRMTGNLGLAHLALIGLFINPEVNAFQYTILSEGLFLPISMLFLSAVLVFAYRGSGGAVLAAATLAGLAATARPLCIPLIGVLIIAVLFRAGERTWRQKLLLLGGVLLAWGTVVAAERVYWNRLHGDRVTSLAGRHIFAKASLIEAAPIDRTGLDPIEQRLASVMETGYAPVRGFLRDSQGSVAYPVMRIFYELCIQHSCSNTLRRQARLPAAEYNQALLRVGSRRLLENPAGYARLAMDEYLSLWVIFSRRHPAIAADFDAYVAKARPVPLEAYLDAESLQPTDPSRVALVARPAFIVVGLLLFLVTIGFGYAVVVRRRTSPLLLFAWLSALCVEAMAVFIALTGTGEGRYTMGMWPYIVMALLMAAMAVYTAAFESRRGAPGRPLVSPQPRLSRAGTD